MLHVLLPHSEGGPQRNPLRGRNCIQAEVSGLSQPSVKLTVQSQDYPPHWIRILLPSTITSYSVLGMSLHVATNPKVLCHDNYRN